jgi:hypothetical protein
VRDTIASHAAPLERHTMPIFQITSRYFKTARSLVAPGLLLAASLLKPIFLHAQSTSLQPAPVSFTSTSADQGSSSSLPDAPDAVMERGRTNNGVQTASASYSTQTIGGASSFPSARQRERHFLLDLVGPTAFIAPAFESGIDTLRPLKVGFPTDGATGSGNHPAHGDVPEWGEGVQGYAKRYADRFGQGLVGTTSRYALGEILRKDVTYHRCQCTGILPRTAHAFLGAYTAQTHAGRAVPSLPAVASPFIASEVAVAAWYPSRYNTSDALRVSVLNYVAAPFKTLFSEFIAK